MSSWQRQFCSEGEQHFLTIVALVLISVINIDAVYRVSPEEHLQFEIACEDQQSFLQMTTEHSF